MTDRTAHEVFEELASEHLTRPGAGRRMMFGRDCLTMNGRNVAFFHDDHLALRLPPDVAASMLAAGEAATALMGKRAMRNWVSVPLSGDPGAAERSRALLGEAAATTTTE
jgi:hypothetical protein